MAGATNTRRQTRRAVIKVFAILMALFMITLAAGTVIGGLAVRDALRAERRAQAETQLAGFEKALRTVLGQIENLGSSMAASLEVAARNQPEQFGSDINKLLSTTPWISAVIIQHAGQTMTFPSGFAGVPIDLEAQSSGGSSGPVFLGPYTLQNGNEVLVYRFANNENVLNLVIGVHPILEAVGFLELEQWAQFTVATGSGQNATVTASTGSAVSPDAEPVSRQLTSANATWTIRLSPRALANGPNNWPLTLKTIIILLLIGYTTPFVGLIIMARAHLRNSRHLEDSRGEVETLSRQLDVALKASEIGMWQHDVESNSQTWDDQILKIYGRERTSDHQTFEEWLACLHPDDQPRFRQFSWKDTARNNGFTSEYRIITPDGTEKYIRSAGNAFRDASGRQQFVGINWDITADVALQKELTEAKATAEARNADLEDAWHQLEEIAYHDSLTGLPNRRQFEERLEAMRATGALLNDTKIMIIDLDGFKSINDTMGHFFGDDVLKFAAQTFSNHLAPEDFLARTGGDEFIMILPSTTNADQLARSIIDAFAKPVEINNRPCRIGASIGIASVQDATETPGNLLIKADIALYEAKKLGRGRTVFFTEDLKIKTLAGKKLGDELLEAIDRGQITAFFQPIFDMNTMHVIGVEALARWRHPVRGILSPDSFMEAAQSIGIIRKIDEIIFNQATDLLRDCLETGVNIPGLSVNVSAERLQMPELMAQVSRCDLPREKLHFELLESISFEHADDSLLQTIQEIRNKGISIDLDDFGSGNASLVGLMNVRPDRLKIARQLIEPITTQPESSLVIQTIVNIANSLEIEVICEGVTSEAHAEILKNLGCHIGQGYLFSRPMSAEHFINFMRNQPDSRQKDH